LSFEEIARVARIFRRLGVEKIRITGGEPLLRKDLERLIAMLGATEGVRDIALTTNGSLLAEKARVLRAVGLHRITVSLDALDPRIFQQMTDARYAVEQVLAGIEAARAAGFGPIKLNMVVKRGVNEEQIGPMARRFGGPEYVLRFIEYMDVGNTNAWRLDQVVPAVEVLERVEREFAVTPLPAQYGGEVARRFRTAVGGEIGLITSVTQPFCRGCTRARLSADGHLYTCLFAAEGRDLRKVLRSAGDAEVEAFLREVWMGRGDRYSEERQALAEPRRKAERSRLGG
jgi:cyclic pyranopterin phosphate synthase